jgi:hypothetical protein
MSLDEKGQKARTALSTAWTVVWDWLVRPMRYKAVHDFRVAAQSRDAARLASLLHDRSAVVVDAGDPEHAAIRVVHGAYEAIALLLHGMAARPGLLIEERSVNGQAGLMLRRDDELIAAITVDFTGGLISTVWVRLHPQRLRHWNHV